MTTTEATSPAQDAIKAAMSVAREVAEGRMDPQELAAAAAEECRELFATVAGPGDVLWELHVEVARRVLALDGIPVDELAEWLAVTGRALRLQGLGVLSFDDDTRWLNGSPADLQPGRKLVLSRNLQGRLTEILIANPEDEPE